MNKLFTIRNATWSLLTLLYATGILCSSTLPGGGADETTRMAIFKNFLHIPAYGGLAFLLGIAFNKGRGPWTVDYGRLTMFLSFFIATAYGVLNEFVQSIIPNRGLEVADMLRNALGAGIVVLVIWVMRRKNNDSIALY